MQQRSEHCQDSVNIACMCIILLCTTLHSCKPISFPVPVVHFALGGCPSVIPGWECELFHCMQLFHQCNSLARRIALRCIPGVPFERRLVVAIEEVGELGGWGRGGLSGGWVGGSQASQGSARVVAASLTGIPPILSWHHGKGHLG